MRRTLLAVAVMVAAVGAYVAFTLPHRATQLRAAVPPTVVYGGYHIHSIRSDGSGNVDQIAAAASRAGLTFIILTDHGDATRQPLVPQYLHGVLTVDAVEIGTNDGHLVALGLRAPSPYPLGGEGRDVLDDVHRMGGFAVVAHPDSPRANLRWRAWNIPYDGAEWLNIDSEWRDETRTHLLGAALRYLVRPPETIASMFRRPVLTLRRWDSTMRLRPIVALAALDAHAGWSTGEEPRRRSWVAIPSYEQMFRTLNQAVILDKPLSGNASDDASEVLTAITQGHTFSIIRAFAGPASIDFSATSRATSAQMGDQIVWTDSLVLRASVPQGPGSELRLLHNGSTVATGKGSLQFPLAGSGTATVLGAYRVEATYADFETPWIVSNPIHVIGSQQAAESTGPPQRTPRPELVTLPPRGGWTIEHAPGSTGIVAADGEWWRFSYSLAPGGPAGQYAAAVSAVEADAGFDQVGFTAHADRPMRISVQLRLPSGKDGERWGRSVYIDQTPRTIWIPLSEFTPLGRTTTLRPIVTQVHAVLFVVDTVNTSPGTSGTIGLSKVSLLVGKPLRFEQ